MKRQLLLSAIVLIAITGIHADDGWVKIGPQQSRTAAVATQDGFLSVRRVVTSESDTLVSEARGAFGAVQAGPYDLGHEWQDILDGILLVETRKGGLLFIKDLLYQIISQPLRADGSPLADAQTLVETNDLFTFDAVSTGSGAMLAWPDLGDPNFVYNAYSLRVSADGDPIKTPQIVSFGTPGFSPLLTEVNLSHRSSPGKGFRVSWKRPFGQSFETATDRKGASYGDVNVFSDNCPSVPAPATLGTDDLIVQAEGCANLDMGFRVLQHDDTWGPFQPLVATPIREGLDCFSQSSIDVVNAGDRLAAIYPVEGAGTLPFTCGLWQLVEFDASGTVFRVRNLFAEFGLDSNSRPSLDWDEDRNRYLLAWGGLGPDGAGNYVMWLDPGEI
jgi:hypothetical protein